MARCQVRGRRGQHLPTRKYHPVGILFLRADKGDVIITTAGSWGVRMVYYWISHTQFSRTFHACLPDIKHRIKGPIPTGPIYYHRLPPSTTVDGHALILGFRTRQRPIRVMLSCLEKRGAFATELFHVWFFAFSVGLALAKTPTRRLRVHDVHFTCTHTHTCAVKFCSHSLPKVWPNVSLFHLFLLPA